MGKQRILLLAESPYFGGITSHILSILDAFQDSTQYEFLVATFSGKRNDTTLIELARTRSVTVHVFNMATTLDVRVLWSLRRFVETQNIHLIHTHNYRATLLCALAAPGPPVVNTFHGILVDPSWRLRVYQWAELVAMRRHRLTIACSEYLRAQLLDKGLADPKVRVVYNAAPPPSASTQAITRDSLEVPPDQLLALFVGRLVSGKGVDTLLEAGAENPAWTILVVGDGPLRPDLEQAAKRWNVDVRFLGFTPNPAPWYCLADVVVLPSKLEALPMALIEAASHGKPVIATPVGGIPEIIQDGHNGLLVPYRDAKAIAHALTRLQDSHWREQMGTAAQAIWQDRFSPPRMADSLTRVYDEILHA